MNSKIRSEITAGLIAELFTDADRLLERASDIAERVDTIAKRVDYEEGRILEAAKILDSASANLEKSASSAVEKNRVALATVLAEALGNFKGDMQAASSEKLEEFFPKVLEAINQHESKLAPEISVNTASLRRIEKKSNSTIQKATIALLSFNLLLLLLILVRLYR